MSPTINGVHHNWIDIWKDKGLMASVWPTYTHYADTGTGSTYWNTTSSSTTQTLVPQPVTIGPPYVDWKYVADAAKHLGNALKAQKSWVKVAKAQAKLPPPPPQRSRPPLDFNRYVNASDLLEEFIKFLGANDVRQSQVMDLPIELFIKWLVIRACEEDHEEPPVVLSLPAPKQKPRCLGCGKFIAKGLLAPLHDNRCATMYFQRTGNWNLKDEKNHAVSSIVRNRA